MIVLAWLRKEPMDLKTFVQNRVAKIQELYPNQLWRHVPSDQNPAVLVSRGVDPDKLLQQNLWFNGPTFLSSDDDYPNRTINCREKLDEYNSELKNCVNEPIENFQSGLNIHVNDFLNGLLNLSNNYITILRVLSFIFRFVENLKGINKVAGPLTTKEFEKAETFLVKKVQEQEFSSDINHLKTVHIELVSDLTSQAFIAALERFMARRGKCAKLFSDNGKNFVGASNEIKKLLEIVRKSDEKLANYLAAEGIEWKFIPARSPNFGGLWEAAIKSCEDASKVAEIAKGVYGPNTVTATYVQFWFRRFRSGIFDVKDAPRTGRPVVKNVDKIIEIIEVDRHVSSRSIAQEIQIEHKTVLTH
ncbi:integrase catalytic domain-containing protein [Trichonephila clavipes]|nr:integrase catalytic domain-containing protein [Trichonephila clavipes]